MQRVNRTHPALCLAVNMCAADSTFRWTRSTCEPPSNFISARTSASIVAKFHIRCQRASRPQSQSVSEWITLQWLAQGGALGGGQAGSLTLRNIGYQTQTWLKDKYRYIFPVPGRENIDILLSVRSYLLSLPQSWKLEEKLVDWKSADFIYIMCVSHSLFLSLLCTDRCTE